MHLPCPGLACAGARRPPCIVLDELDGAAHGAEGHSAVAALVKLVTGAAAAAAGVTQLLTCVANSATTCCCPQTPAAVFHRLACLVYLTQNVHHLPRAPLPTCR